jgi:hypothetical protein
MATIRVPRTPKTSYNPKRKPSGLLLAQLEHLQWASLPASDRTSPEHLKKRKERRPKTEGEAAAHIERLTRKVLEPHGENVTHLLGSNREPSRGSRTAQKPRRRRN